MENNLAFHGPLSAGRLTRSQAEDYAKRASDLMVACALIIFTLPLMMLVALAIKWDSKGPIFYRQTRVGLGARPFDLLKFRSMVRDAERDGRPVWAADRDARITRVGRFIRKVRLDELPQLINVLRGEMSLVGPRPERPYFVDQLSQPDPALCRTPCGEARNYGLGTNQLPLWRFGRRRSK